MAAFDGRTSPRASTPWIVAGLVAAGLVPTLWLSIRNDSVREDPYFIPIAVMMIVGYTGVGAMLASRLPHNPIGWLMLAVGVLFLSTGLSDEYIQYAYAQGESTSPLAPVAALVTSIVWMPMLAIVSLILILFPTGRVPSPRWRPFVWVILAAIALFLVGAVTAPGPLEDALEGVEIENPLGIEAAGSLARLASTTGSIAGILCLLPSVAALVVRYRRARGEERQQIRWLAAVVLTVLALVLVQIVVAVAIGGRMDTSYLDDALFLGAFALVALGVPITVAVAVLKYRLYDLDLVVKKTIVFGTLVALVMAVSVAALLTVGTRFGDLSRAGSQAVGIAMFLVGVAVWPLWRLSRRIADRVVYGGRASPYEVLTEFSHRLGDTYSVDDVLPRMAQLLGEATGAASAHVWVRAGDGFRLLATWPAARAPVEPIAGPSERSSGMAEVRDRGEILGALSIETTPSDPMGPSKERLVRDLAAQAGLLLRNVRLIEDLRESRRRIVSAQDDRAKTLERNIHDGAQQQLVALGIKARLARTLAERDPGKAAEMLEQIEAESRAALEDLRDLARGIYPPLLADQGLAAALTAQVRKAPFPVTLNPDGLARYDQDVEASIYFCVLEALQNVAKYAEASSAHVELRAVDGEIRFEVTDDGRGFDTRATSFGTGLQGIADRLAALGGGVDVRSAPGRGTTIAGWIPA